VGRPGTADEIAKAVFPASDNSSYSNRNRVVRRWRLGSDITGGLPGTKTRMQSVEDLLAKNLEELGERAAEKPGTALSPIWETYIA
jgi:hypothetical protein